MKILNRIAVCHFIINVKKFTQMVIVIMGVMKIDVIRIKTREAVL